MDVLLAGGMFSRVSQPFSYVRSRIFKLDVWFLSVETLFFH